MFYWLFLFDAQILGNLLHVLLVSKVCHTHYINILYLTFFLQLLPVHAPFVHELKERVVDAREGAAVGYLLQQHAVAMQVYVSYVRNVQAALATVAVCEERAACFREYLHYARGNPRVSEH